MSGWDDLWPRPISLSLYREPYDLVLEPSLVVEDTVFGHQERGRRRGTETTRQKGQLTSEQLAQIDGYRARKPDASDKQIAEHLAPKFGCTVRTLRGKLAALGKK